MAQLTKYTHGDAGAPVLSGTVGSLVALLKACLVDGYGSKTGAGWTQPIATASNIGCFKQGSGSYADAVVLISDNAPGVAAGAREAWATGWKTIAGVGSPVGTGTGQFPTPAQLLTTGHVAIRKSSALDASAMPWVIFADDRTFYLFTRTNDIVSGTNYAFFSFGFGEFYSVEGSGYANNCFISGRQLENYTTLNSTVSNFDRFVNLVNTTTSLPGAYFMDNVAGSAGSQLMYFSGDTTANPTSLGAVVNQNSSGGIAAPAGNNSAYYISNCTVSDASGNIRGRLRGIYYHSHPASAIGDGATITGAGDLTGKVFETYYPGTANGHWMVETSNTVDTN